MSWFNNLVETYSRVSDIIGVPDANGNILLPSNHMAAKVDICVTIDGNGKFRRAAENKENIMIPCTEDSSSRSGSAVFPHPLHDQIGYLALDERKRDKYLAQLKNWKSQHPKVEAVYKYVLQNSLIDDLIRSELKTDPKIFICFSVETSLDDLTPQLWKDKSVADAWRNYCEQNQTEDKTLCYATGKTEPSRTKHPKGVNPVTNGAKLISCNDETNYTYRGRFVKSEQANAIGASASHQAHAMLRYLIATQGYRCDTQAVVAWAVDDGSSAASPFADSRQLTLRLIDPLGLYDESEEDEKSDSEKIIAAHGEIDVDYAKNLRNALAGKGNAKKLQNSARRIAVIAVDAATTGRMSVTFYKDLLENEYIDRIVDWHETCCWWFWGKRGDYISAPSADKIIAAVYGEPKGESYGKIKKMARERLLHCILNGERLNRTWLSAAVERVSNPFSYDKQDGGWDKYKWEKAMAVTCAIARKYYIDSIEKEAFTLELDKTCNDRDYLYGRLLAVADRIENHARFLQHGKDDNAEKRPTNAVRYMTAFSAKPFRTWKLIYEQLNPYIMRLNGGEWYQQQIDEIKSLFKSMDEYESDKSLSGKYLMGYSLQRRALQNKKNEEEVKNAE